MELWRMDLIFMDWNRSVVGVAEIWNEERTRLDSEVGEYQETMQATMRTNRAWR
jgi:hypothetical protein